MRVRVLLVGVLIAGGAVGAGGQPVYHSNPDWESADTPVSTGAALVDLDRDGWLDLVVSNGNDIALEHVAVYYNNGDGTFPPAPQWQSLDHVYNGHLDVADVNGDGWLDVAVATLGEFSSTGPVARVYLNNAGTLSSGPDWMAAEIGNAFGVAFGDVNNDGRPDLAVATGWAYGTPHQYYNLVYLNTGSGLENHASWHSADSYDSQGATWVDANGDGWLDLALACANRESRLYLNQGGTLEANASWVATDVGAQDAIMVTAGDVTDDGLPELFFADNNQLTQGTGRFRQYNGVSPGTFQTAATWTFYEGYCSAVALADVDADGDLDLATGGWWEPVRLFLNSGSGLAATSGWSWFDSSVVAEKLVFGDVDKNGLRAVTHLFTPTSGQRLFQLPHRPIQRVTEVAVDGGTLNPDQYHVNYECGWLTIGTSASSSVRVNYTVSSKLDLAVTDWAGGNGNVLFYNQLVVRGDANCDGQVSFDDINPFVMLLVGGYDQAFPDCDGEAFCDMNQDGVTDFDDINPFVTVIVGGE